MSRLEVLVGGVDVTQVDVHPLSVPPEVVRQGPVELVLVGLVSHVPDRVEV